MRKYYLFLIKDDFYSIYKDNANVLYVTLENIYKLKNNNYSYVIPIFSQICGAFNFKIIANYLMNKNKKYIKKYKNIFFVNDIYAHEKTCIQVNRSCVVIKTTSNMPYAMKIFNWYDNKIFVCDFDNHDYFWLNDILIKCAYARLY